MGMCMVFTNAETGADALKKLAGKKGTDCRELFESDFSAMVGKMLKLLEVTNENN